MAGFPGHCLINFFTMGKPANFMILLSFIFMIALSACDNEEPINTSEPANLVVQISLSEDIPGLATITATADNTAEYQLRVDNSEEPVATNVTGLFEYTFIHSGTYQVDVRAYGNSGKYLKEVRQVVVDLSNDTVSLETGYTTPLSYEGYNLVWNDEFSGNQVNTNDWVFEIGDGCPNCGWGNNELQYYRQENAYVGNGVLTIEAKKESIQNKNYTSARLKTQGKKSFQYGRIDIRALLPKGQGIWPALWMLGNNISTIGWPYCGEIDIMEMVGGNGRDNQVHGTLHWDNNGHNYVGGSYSLSSGIFAHSYHVFSITWDENIIKWFVDDVQFYELSIAADHMSEFHQQFFFIINLAVGGNWPGNPNETTVFPQKLRVDYIRMFQKANQ